jgi:hypothetical protein
MTGPFKEPADEDRSGRGQPGQPRALCPSTPLCSFPVNVSHDGALSTTPGGIPALPVPRASSRRGGAGTLPSSSTAAPLPPDCPFTGQKTAASADQLQPSHPCDTRTPFHLEPLASPGGKGASITPPGVSHRYSQILILATLGGPPTIHTHPGEK